ncbi:MAG: response regulator [Candidatus Omnitrophica bacterium]|nr:response regulator [Candidatus Omnitrophota bacterium]
MDNKRVLIVDDEIDFLTLIKKRIESWGYRVITASSKDEALEALDTTSPRVIILDYMMPDINGIELLRKIRKTNKKIPVVMFTAQPTMAAMAEAKELDIVAFIPKESSMVDTEKSLKMALELIFQNP